MSTYTQADADAIRKAIKSGVLVARNGDTTTTFRSLKEMQEILRQIEGELGTSTRIRRKRAVFRNGT